MTAPSRSDRAWSRLYDWMATLSDLSGTARLLDWDRETAMPAGGTDGRSHQFATLSAIRHREVLAPDIDDAIADIEASGDLTELQRAQLRLARRERVRAARIPEALVRETSEATSAGISSWLQHRVTGDFASFAPALARVVSAVRQVGEALDTGDEPYDGLLDEHEPGMTAAQLEPLFEHLRTELTAIAEPVADHPPITVFADREWPDGAQIALATQVAEMVGFHFDAGMIARSAHPFTTSPHPGDVRFTTRIDPLDPTSNVLVTMHEVGHALYSQGHPQELARTLAYSSPSLGAEESQARFFENHIGRSGAFWEHVHPTLVAQFGDAMDGISPHDLHMIARRVARGTTRVEADELTYDLHIVLRFQLELALIRGDLPVADLPGAWKEGIERLLGVTPIGNADGCMQDIHWGWGSFGYFPTYTIGNLYAAQLREAFEAEHGPLDACVRSGDLMTPTRFMQERIHRHGGVHPTEELMRRATGQEFSAEPFLRRMRLLAAAARR